MLLLLLSACGRIGYDRVQATDPATLPSLGELPAGESALGSGKGGPLVIDSASLVVNAYASILQSAEAGSSALLIDGSELERFAADTLVLVWQSARRSNRLLADATPLDPVAERIGHWETVRIAAREGSRVSLQTPLSLAYSAPGAQLVTLPEYTDVDIEVGATLRGEPWNGASGGIVALLATGRVRVAGRIDVAASGLRGGQPLEGPNQQGCNGLDEAPPRGAPRGEGFIPGRYGMSETGRGNVANGGGGGICNRSGGGGGGAVGAGGQGGLTDNWDSSRSVGGLGGIGSQVVDARLTLGGGGGTGHANLEHGGGDGGGVIFIRAASIDSTEGILDASGASIASASAVGGSGGGGGGTVLLDARNAASRCGNLSVRGGKGADTYAWDDHPYGTGGGGGGGRVILTGDWQCEPNVAGGLKGLMYPYNGSNGGFEWGAADGGEGAVTRVAP